MPAVFIIAGIFYLWVLFRGKNDKTKMIILYRLKVQVKHLPICSSGKNEQNGGFISL
jgi:hypothetical protein